MSSRPAIDFGLYLITDRANCGGRSLLETVEQALQGGARAVQLREKDLSGRRLFDLACELRRLTTRYGARLFINDRIDVALAAEADGVHLGGESLPTGRVRALLGDSMLLGVSCHDLHSARSAQEGGADFITFGPVFYTPSKAAYGEPVGTDSLGEAARVLSIPVFALGGITKDTVPEVIAAGAAGIALISAVLAAPQPAEKTAALLALLRKA